MYLNASVYSSWAAVLAPQSITPVALLCSLRTMKWDCLGSICYPSQLYMIFTTGGQKIHTFVTVSFPVYVSGSPLLRPFKSPCWNSKSFFKLQICLKWNTPALSRHSAAHRLTNVTWVVQSSNYSSWAGPIWETVVRKTCFSGQDICVSGDAAGVCLLYLLVHHDSASLLSTLSLLLWSRLLYRFLFLFCITLLYVIQIDLTFSIAR